MNIKKHHNFVVDHYSKMDGQQYYGEFTSKRLSIMDQTKIAVRQSQLSGGAYCVKGDDGKPNGMGIPEEAEFANRMIAHLEIALIKKPSWWNLEELADEELILKVYQEVIRGDMTFRGLTEPKKEGSVGDGSDKGVSTSERSQSVGGDNIKKVVGKEVSDALDI